MADRDKPPKIPAAGALLWRPGEQGPEVVLVHRPRYDDWSFPKGKCLPGEHVLITAVREVTEETEIEVTLGRRLRTVRYLSDGRPKQVDYWAARPAAQAAGGTGEPAAPVPFTPNEEVDQIAWLPLTAAGDQLTYQHDTDLLERVRVRAGRHHGDHPGPACLRAEQEGLAERRASGRSHPPADPARARAGEAPGPDPVLFRPGPGDQLPGGALPGDRRALCGGGRRGG